GPWRRLVQLRPSPTRSVSDSLVQSGVPTLGRTTRATRRSSAETFSCVTSYREASAGSAGPNAATRPEPARAAPAYSADPDRAERNVGASSVEGPGLPGLPGSPGWLWVVPPHEASVGRKQAARIAKRRMCTRRPRSNVRATRFFSAIHGDLDDSRQR